MYASRLNKSSSLAACARGEVGAAAAAAASLAKDAAILAPISAFRSVRSAGRGLLPRLSAALFNAHHSAIRITRGTQLAHSGFWHVGAGAGGRPSLLPTRAGAPLAAAQLNLLKVN